MKIKVIALSCLLLSFSSCGDECNKIYTISGKVLDETSSALSGVDVAFVTASDYPKATTDSNGNYSFIVEGPGKLEGASLIFSKSGYTNTTSAPFTASEAGEEACGNISLSRDAALAP